MRITIFTNTYKPAINGVVRSITTFRNGLLERGREVHLITPQYDEDLKDEEPYVFRFPAVDLTDSIEAAIPLPFKLICDPLIHGLKPNIIHSQHPLLMGNLAAAYAKELNVPLIFTFHTRYDDYAQKHAPLIPELSAAIIENMVQRYLRKCSHIIAPTPGTREQIEKYDVDVPITVIPTPIDLEPFEKADPDLIRRKLELDQKFILLYVGRIAVEKSLGLLLKAFALIRKKHSKAHLLLVGQGPEEGKLKKQARELDIADDVRFAGAVPFEEIPGYAAAADLFVFPSTSETQGLVLVEAMAAGTPVVAVEGPGQNDVLAGGGGKLVEGTPEALSDAVLGLISDPEALKYLGDEAKKEAAQYNIPAAVDAMLAVYEKAATA